MNIEKRYKSKSNCLYITQYHINVKQVKILSTIEGKNMELKM